MKTTWVLDGEEYRKCVNGVFLSEKKSGKILRPEDDVYIKAIADDINPDAACTDEEYCSQCMDYWKGLSAAECTCDDGTSSNGYSRCMEMFDKVYHCPVECTHEDEGTDNLRFLIGFMCGLMVGYAFSL